MWRPGQQGRIPHPPRPHPPHHLTVLALALRVRLRLHVAVAAWLAAGERDEALDELKADLMDVKTLYKDQVRCGTRCCTPQ